MIFEILQAIINGPQIADGLQVQYAIAPLVIPAIMGVSSLLSGWLGGRNKQKQTTTGTQTNTGQSSALPGWAPQFSPLQNALLPMVTQKLLNPTALPAGYEQAGIRNINKTYDLAGQSLKNKLTSQGMGQSGSARAGTSGLEGGRASDIVQFQGTLPMVERQWRQEDLNNAMNLYQMGRGVNSTSSNTGQSQQQGETGGPGGVHGALGGLTDALGWMYGAGMFDPKAAGNLPSTPAPGGIQTSGGAPVSTPGFPGTVAPNSPYGSMGMPGQTAGGGTQGFLPGETAGMPNSYSGNQGMGGYQGSLFGGQQRQRTGLFGLPQGQQQQQFIQMPRTRF